MDTYGAWVVGGVALVVGMLLGVLIYAWWQHRMALAQRRVPRQSPIVKRALVNSREKTVWRWLRKTFAEHHVMIKMPVTRFTMPMAEADREQWFALLTDVYCTFTLTTPEGKVIGCVDVPGANGLSPSNLVIKRKVFARCGVPHWVVQPDSLPKASDIYNSFVVPVEVLEASAESAVGLITPRELDKARAELTATVSRRRTTQGGTRAPKPEGEDSQFMDSVLSTDWAPDSFNSPLDSRAGELR